MQCMLTILYDNLKYVSNIFIGRFLINYFNICIKLMRYSNELIIQKIVVSLKTIYHINLYQSLWFYDK
jgi:hypothetical protein